MTVPAESQKTIDAYLMALRKQLRELMDEDANDIVEEIRAHILDKTSSQGVTGNVSSTLAALGTPAELASRYRTDELLKRARVTHSPVVSLHSLFRWATLSLVGLVVFLVSVVGYCLGGMLVMIALIKAMNPHSTGLWVVYVPDHTWSASFGSGAQPPPHGYDPLGLWLIPIGLFLGSGLLFLTFRFGTWSIRKFWRPRALREGRVSPDSDALRSDF